MGDEDLSEEAIHTGYGSVVRMMWLISDRLAPRVAKDVYAQLFLGEIRPDYRDAVERLRNSTDVGFVDWLPFVHLGL